MGSRKSQGNFLYLPPARYFSNESGIYFSGLVFFVLGGGPWLEGRCLETKRILAYAEFLFRENDLSGTKWGVRRVLFRLKRFRGTKCIRLKVLFHMSVFPERNHRG